MSILENLKEVLPEWTKISVRELPYKIEYEIHIQPTITEDEHFELTPKLKELDTVQAFESDDEVGHFFVNLKNIVMTINTYMQNYSK